MHRHFTRLILIGVVAAGVMIGCGRRAAGPGTTSSSQTSKQGAAPKAKVDGNPAQLIQAIDGHNIAALKQLLDRGVRADDFLPLCEAAERNDVAATALLLERGAKVETKDQDGTTALVCAARTLEDTTDTMKLLIAKGATSEDKTQALLTVAEASPPLTMSVSPAEAEKLMGTTAPEWNPEAAAAKKVKLLLDNGVPVDVRDKVRENATPLIWAARFGNTAVVQLLLSKGAEVDSRDNRGGTALIDAACSCAIADMPYTLDSVRLLLKKGADAEAKDKDDTTALMAAAGWGRSEIIALLLENGARIDDRDKHGDTALLIAAKTAFPTAAAVKVLLKKGAAVNTTNNEGNTALILAASSEGSEDAQIVKLLLAYGADPQLKNNRGETALNLAEKNRRSVIVQLLKKAMANPAHRDSPEGVQAGEKGRSKGKRQD